MKIAYCGYDFFSGVLEEVIKTGNEVLELFTWPCDNAYDFNISVIEQASLIKARIQLSPIEESDLVRLHDKGVELLLSAAYPYKIPEWKEYLPKAVNVHPTKLPEGRGRWPLPWIILKGLKNSAVTIHKISSDWDAGDIIKSINVDVLPRENLETLSMKKQMAARELIHEFLSDADHFWNGAKPQGSGSYWQMPNDEDRTIRWESSVEEIDRVVRAFGKFDSYAMIDGVLKYVTFASVWSQEHTMKPGTVVHRASRELIVAASDGFVCIRGLDE